MLLLLNVDPRRASVHIVLYLSHMVCEIGDLIGCSKPIGRLVMIFPDSLSPETTILVTWIERESTLIDLI